MTGRRLGVLVMAYGTPRRRAEIEPYYTDIRRGRPPTPEQLAELVRRYDAIGGLSPLLERTEAQRAAIASALGDDATVAVGLRHAQPSIEEGVATLSAAGVERIVGVVLAPHYSALSVGVYHQRAGDAAAARDVGYTGVGSWATEPAMVEFLAREVERLRGVMPTGTRILFTAHSLPRRILDDGDPYPSEVAATASAVAAVARFDDSTPWAVGWQSAGRTPEPWLGPDVLEVIDDLATGAAPGLLVCPCGFVADHLEVLYDLDIEARGRADARGLAFARTPVVNDDNAVMRALAARIVAA